MFKKLYDIAEYVQDKVLVKDLNNDTYISTENMLPNKNGITSASTLPNISQTPKFKNGDILVSNIRPYFKKIWYANFSGGCSNDVLILRAKEGVSSKFLYYVLSNDYFFDYCMATAKGTKMPRGDKNSIMKYDVPNFSLENQDKIASILFSIDEKINLNTKTNNNLEQQAQAIFKSWFVDFEPFGGTMPSDWEESTLGDLVEIKRGGIRRQDKWNFA